MEKHFIFYYVFGDRESYEFVPETTSFNLLTMVNFYALQVATENVSREVHFYMKHGGPVDFNTLSTLPSP